MPVDRSQTLPAALPPTDHVARALLKRGARHEALTLLRAAVARDPGERACAALLRAVEARPDAAVGGPELALDLDVVDAHLRSGMLLEAMAVLRGAALDGTPRGQWRAQMLEELLSPCPPGTDEELREVDRQLRTGGAAVALSMLEERIEKDAFMPEWARRRHALLSELLLERAEDAPGGPSLAFSGAPSPVAQAVSEALARRDVHGALAAARTAAQGSPGDVEARAVAEALGRLVEAMAGASAEMSQHQLSTQPMRGHTIALFQLRMGNLGEAERYFRKIVLEAPLDTLARRRLDDVQTVRSVVEAGAADPWRRTRVDPLLETVRDAPAVPALLAPALPEARLAFKQTMPLPDEQTRRAIFEPPDPFAGEAAAPAGPEEPAPVEVSLDAITREVTLEDQAAGEREVHRERKARPSSPGLLHKRQRRIGADPEWAPAAHASIEDWEEDRTEVGSPTEQAELLLKQGFAQKALDTYDMLVAAAPEREALVRRRDEIRELVRLGAEPCTSVGVELPELDALEADPTVVSRSLLSEPAVRVHRIIRID